MIFLVSTTFKDILYWDRIIALLSTMLDNCACLGSLGNMPMNMMVVIAPDEPMSTIIYANLSDLIFLVSNAIKGQYILVENTALMLECNTCLDSLGNTPPILLS